MWMRVYTQLPALGRIWVHWDTVELGSTDTDTGTGITQRYDNF